MKRNLWMQAAFILISGMVVLTSCKHNMDDYTPQPYTSTGNDRLKYAEQVLGVTIDPQQDWTLTNRYSVKVNVNADLEDINQVAVTTT